MHPRNLVALLVAASIMAACNIGAPSPLSLTAQQLADTAVAQTLQAGSVTPFASPAVGTTPLASPAAGTKPASPSPSTTVTITPTGAKAQLSITGNSNCRSGPGGSFANITAFAPGAKLEIVAKNTDTNYWQVKIPGTSDTCWVWGQYATATGDIEHLPTAAPATPDTSAQNVPARPAPLTYQFECLYPSGSGPQVKVDLRWPDKASNETGYYVYRQGNQIADLPADSTSYSDTTAISSGQVLVYGVAAYNDTGTSPQAVTTGGDPITCQ